MVLGFSSTDFPEMGIPCMSQHLQVTNHKFEIRKIKGQFSDVWV
jgi:hypothetical protein